MKLEEFYILAYGDRKPFKDKKNAGSFLNALLVGYLNEELYRNSDADTFCEGPLDLFFGLMNELNISINDVIEGTYRYYQNKENDIDIDDLLSSNFSQSPIFMESFIHKFLLDQPKERMERIGVSFQNLTFEENSLFFRLFDEGALDYCENGVVIKDYVRKIKEIFSFKKYNLKEVTALVREEMGLTFSNDMDSYKQVYRKFVGAIESNSGNEQFCSFSKKVKEISDNTDGDFNDSLEHVLRIDEIYNRNGVKDEFVSDKKTFDNQDDFIEKKASEDSLLKKYVIGQDEALEKIEDRLLSSTLGFNDCGKPIASFLLTGPTGVGKTETAKQVANLWCDGKIQTIDMTTYTTKEDVSRLVGSSPGYVGYTDSNPFIEYVKKNPKCVLLFDEIDKCHRECLDILMRMLDEGEFVTAKNEKILLTGAIIFCTTNLTEYLKGDKKTGSLNQIVTSSGGLRKEIVGRFDEVIEYKQIERDDYLKIAKVFLDKVIENFNKNNLSKKIELIYDNGLLEGIVDSADYRTLGARAIRSSIQHNFINKLSKFIIKNNCRNCKIKVTGDQIEILKKR